MADASGGGAYATVRAQLRFGAGNSLARNEALGPAAKEDGNGGGLHASCRSYIWFDGGNVVGPENLASVNGGGVSLRHSKLTARGLWVISNRAEDGLGGGIYATDLTAWKEWGEFVNAPCDNPVSITVDGSMISDNYAKRNGGGVAVWTDLDPRAPYSGWTSLGYFGASDRHKVFRGSILRGNSTDGLAAGMWFVTTPEGDANLTLDGCLIDQHDPGGWKSGVSLDTHGRAQVVVNETVFVNNGNGLLAHGVEGRITGGAFQRHGSFQLGVSGDLTSLRVSKVLFDGGGVTPDGIAATGLPHWWFGEPLEVHESDIVNHTLLGGRNAGSTGISATRNWWGNAAGPLRIAPPAPPRDVVSSGLVTDFPLAAPSGAAAGGTPVLWMPAAAVFKPPWLPDCENARPSQEDAPPRRPGGVQEGRHESGSGGWIELDGQLRLLRWGAASGRTGVAIPALGRAGPTAMVFDPVLAAKPKARPRTPSVPPEVEFHVWRGDIYNARAPGFAVVRPAAATALPWEEEGVGDEAWALELDGWPLLVAVRRPGDVPAPRRPKKPKVRIAVSRDYDSVAAVFSPVLLRYWKLSLYLPAPRAWNEGGVEAEPCWSEEIEPGPFPKPVAMGLCAVWRGFRSGGRGGIVRLKTPHPRFAAVLHDFKGGTVRLRLEYRRAGKDLV